MSNEMPEEIWANSTMPSKSTGTWGCNQLEGDKPYKDSRTVDDRVLVDALIEAARNLEDNRLGINEGDKILEAIQAIKEARESEKVNDWPLTEVDDIEAERLAYEEDMNDGKP